jgi:hypothetical protein
MELLICEFCENKFTTKTVLLNHQKRAKYCLDIQKEKENKNIQEDFKNCQYCNKSYSSNTIKRHEDICKVKKENNFLNLIKELEESKKQIIWQEKEIQNYQIQIEEKNKQIEEKNQKIEKLEDTIAKIAAKPRTTTTNNTVNNQRYNQIIQNLSPITQETLDELPSKLEDRHISQGPHGYVVFVQENLQDKLVCTDIARKKLTFKDEKNNIITDINGRQITYKIFKSIHELRANLVETKKSKAKTELEKTQAVLYYGAEDAAIGKFLNMQEESVFSNKFISELSSKFYIKNIPICKDSEIEELELEEDDIEYLVLSDG